MIKRREIREILKPRAHIFRKVAYILRIVHSICFWHSILNPKVKPWNKQLLSLLKVKTQIKSPNQTGPHSRTNYWIDCIGSLLEMWWKWIYDIENLVLSIWRFVFMLNRLLFNLLLHHGSVFWLNLLLLTHGLVICVLLEVYTLILLLLPN